MLRRRQMAPGAEVPSLKLTCGKILECGVAKSPGERPWGRTSIAPHPPADAGKPYRVLDGNQGATKDQPPLAQHWGFRL